jgi:hypothetical protein
VEYGFRGLWRVNLFLEGELEDKVKALAKALEPLLKA